MWSGTWRKPTTGQHRPRWPPALPGSSGKNNIQLKPQSYEWTRGTVSYLSTFVYWGSSDWRKVAAWHKFDMVWLYRSPIPVERRGCFTSSNDFYLPALHLEEEGGGQHPACGLYSTVSHFSYTAHAQISESSVGCLPSNSIGSEHHFIWGSLLIPFFIHILYIRQFHNF